MWLKFCEILSLLWSKYHEGKFLDQRIYYATFTKIREPPLCLALPHTRQALNLRIHVGRPIHKQAECRLTPVNNEQAEWPMCWRISKYSPIKRVSVVRCFRIVFTSLYYKSILQVLQLYWLVSQSQVICQKKRIDHKLAHTTWASMIVCCSSFRTYDSCKWSFFHPICTTYWCVISAVYIHTYDKHGGIMK